MNEQTLFLAALDCEDEADRERLLNEHCAGDQGLRRRVEQLLERYDNLNSFLERPIAATSVSELPSVLRELERDIGNIRHVRLKDNSSPKITLPIEPDLADQVSAQKYQIHGEIARGGMGAIIKCHDSDLGRDLVLKVLLNSHRKNPDHVRRFIEEAQIGGQLQHPGIAPVHELGRLKDGRPFFSMQLVRGETLAALLARRGHPMNDLESLIGIFEQVCRTIGYAHSRRVIHRDLKPSNIMVGRHGEVQVMDWGLAKVLGTGGRYDDRRAADRHHTTVRLGSAADDASASDDTHAGSRTNIGSVMGTVAYMPPEQALGKVDLLDERADVFAIGGILAEILSGAPPYIAKHWEERYQLASRGDLTDCVQRVEASQADPELKQLALDCLAPDREDRPSDAIVVADRMADYRRHVQERLRKAELARAATDARMAEEHRRRRLSRLATLLLVCLVTIATIFAVVFNRMAGENEQLAIDASDRARLQKIHRLAAESRAVSSEFSTAGLLLALEAIDLSRENKGVMNPQAHAAAMQVLPMVTMAGLPLKIDGTHVDDFQMTEDHLIAICGGQLRIWNYRDATPTATERVLSEAGNHIQHIQLNRSGTRMVSIGNQLIVWNLQDDVIRPSVLFDGVPVSASISDNGRWLVSQQSADPSALDDRESPAPNRDAPRSPSSDQAPILVWDLSHGSKPLAIARTNELERAQQMSISSDGRWLAAVIAADEDTQATDTIQLWVLGRDSTAALKPIPSPTGTTHNLRFCPQSQFLIAQTDREVIVWDLRHEHRFSSPRRIPSAGRYMHVSSDSRWLFCLSPDLNSLQRVRLADESQDFQPFHFDAPSARFTSLAISGDGTCFLGGSCDGNARLWQGIDSSEPLDTFVSLPTCMVGATQLRISPDGRWIATAYPDGMIRLRDIKGLTHRPLVLESPRSIPFAPIATSSDGRWIASATDQGAVVLWDTQTRLAAETKRLLHTRHNARRLSFDPQDRWLVAGLDNGTFAIWDLSDPDAANTIVGANDQLGGQQCAFTITPDGSRLITSHNDNTLRVWDLQRANFETPMFELQGHDRRLWHIMVSPNGRWLATGTNSTLLLWDLDDAAPQDSVVTLATRRDEQLWGLATDGDGRYLAAGWGQDIYLWDLRGGREAPELRVIPPSCEEEQQVIWRIEMSRDGRWVFTSRFNATAQLWDVRQPVATSKRLVTNGVQDSVLSPDGRWLVTCKRGPNLQLFDLDTDDPTRSGRLFSCPGETLWGLAVSADSRWLVSSSGEGRVRRWLLDPDSLYRFAREMAGRDLTGDERTLYGLDD